MTINPADDGDLRRRLRKDRQASIAVLAGCAAGLAAVLAWMGVLLPADRAVNRIDPLYWLMVAPLVAWALAATGFAPWALRLLRPILIVAPLAAAAALVWALLCAQVSIMPWVLAAIAAAAAGALGWRARARSLMASSPHSSD
jgi:hypothetical protein